MADAIPQPGAPKVLAIVQAGGKGSRMGVLTADRAKPALPFGGTHQLIDIALSNLSNSGIGDVWVSVQYLAGTLDQHLQHGRPWDLDRNRGGFRRVVPEQADESRDGGFSTGNADDLYRIRHDIQREDADVVVVLSADQVFALDLRDVVAAHLAKRADLTIVTTEVSRTEASNKAVVTVDATGKVTRVEEKPESADHGTISAEVFLYRKDALLDALETAESRLRSGGEGVDGEDSDDAPDDDDTGLGDFAEHLLPELISRGAVHAYPLPGYWKDMGRPETYLSAHRDLVRGRLDIFENRDWVMRTLASDHGAARIRETAQVEDSLISPGCDVAGTVRRSTLGPGVTVREGAVVEDSVVFAGVLVEKDAVVRTALIDEGVALRQGAQVGQTPASTYPRDADIAVIGHHAVVRGNVGPGESVEPGETVEKS